MTPQADAPAAALPVLGRSRSRLKRGWLAFARALWGVVALAATSVMLSAIAVRLAALGSLPAVSVPSGWTPDAFRSALSSLGLSVEFYIGLNLLFAYLLMFGFLATAVVIFFRRSDDWVGQRHEWRRSAPLSAPSRSVTLRQSR